MALLIEDARPALATGTEAMRADVSGATSRQMPIPNMSDGGSRSTK